MRSGWGPLSLSGAIAAGSLLLYAVRPEGVSMKLLGNGAQVLGTVVAVAFLSMAAKGFGRADVARCGWVLLSLSAAANLLGFASFGLLELLGRENPFPSVADLFFLLAYPIQLYALLMLAQAYRRSGLPLARGKWAWAATVGALVLVGVFALAPIAADVESPAAERFLLGLYPVADALLIGATVYMWELVAQFGRGLVALPWKWIVAGSVLQAVTDALYGILGSHELYYTGHPVDLGWVFSFLLIGVGGWHQYRLMTETLPGGGSSA